MNKIISMVLLIVLIFTTVGCSKIEHKDRGIKLNVCNLSKHRK